MDEARFSRNTTNPKDHTKFTKKHGMIIVVVVILLLLVIIIGALLATILKTESSEDSYTLAEHPLILVSFDGFRAEYLTRDLTPNFNNFGRTGVQAKFMMSQFPTKTFPNHYTIATGLYPESHGIVFNNFYDTALRKKFTIRNSKNPAFWGGEPIWVTAEKSGMKTASYYWVGSEVKGLRPTYYRDYNQSVPASTRLDQVIKWLQLPKKERPSFITLYFHEPDYTGHGFGPDSKELNDQLKVVDGIFGDLVAAINKINMTNKVNLIVVSDHGMSYINCNKNRIFLDKYGVLKNELYWNNLGPVGSFTMKKTGDNQKILNKIKCVNDSFQAFNKKNLPKRMHFSNNRRIDEIIVIPDQGETVAIDSTSVRKRCFKGAHGYDNISPDMHSIFLARGPSFKKNKMIEHFSNIEIYNLLAALLKITPAQNNGTMGSLNNILINDSKQELSKPTGDGNTLRTDICQFPNGETVKARKCCNCSGCNELYNNNTSALEKILNISSDQAKAYQVFHLPWGIPNGGAGVEGCLMTQPDSIIGYSTYLRIPLWVANRVNGSVSNFQMETCFGYDVRLTKNQAGNCTSYKDSGFVQGSLGQSVDLVDNNSSIGTPSSSTIAIIVPQYPNFDKEIWENLERLVQKWSLKYENVYVISGSIFDMDDNGIKDDVKLQTVRLHGDRDNSAIPTHFYKIVTRCNSTIKGGYQAPGCNGSLQVISFILRNTNEWCLFHEWQKILLLNVARVKDIELLTGINFFPELPAQSQAEIKTFLPFQLWS